MNKNKTQAGPQSEKSETTQLCYAVSYSRASAKGQRDSSKQ